MSKPGAFANPLVRRVLWTLATLALALKILVPPGMMLATGPRNDLPFAVVMCTGQGMVSVAPGAPIPSKDGEDPGKTTSQAPCVFAGQGLGAEAPVIADLGRIEFVAFQAAAPLPAPAVSPGRGLSGPPLPPRGPPTLLI